MGFPKMEFQVKASSFDRVEAEMLDLQTIQARRYDYAFLLQHE